MQYLPDRDPVVARIIQQEESRIEKHPGSHCGGEPCSPVSFFQAQGSIFSTKAAEGYLVACFHAGDRADELESLAIA